MSEKATTSWGSVAGWYDNVVESDDSYQSQVILPNLVRMMDLSKGDEVIDIACGQGYFARAYHQAGAHVVGIDIGEGLIKIAQEKSSKEIDYIVGSAEELADISNESCNKASIVLALQNIENLQKTIQSASRILRRDGKLFIVLNHPSFRIPGRSEWGFDQEKDVQFRRIDGYISEHKKEMVMNPGAHASEQIKTLSFHRPLQVYAKALFKAGLAITRLEEWVSHKESEPGPRQKAEDRSRKEFPLFMALECTKVI
jgi:ubiquinone/menaquinone biosynthesis C-methylase UbiE